MLKRGNAYRRLPDGRKQKVKVKVSLDPVPRDKQTITPFLWYNVRDFVSGEKGEILDYLRKKFGLSLRLTTTRLDDSRMFRQNKIRFYACLYDRTDRPNFRVLNSRKSRDNNTGRCHPPSLGEVYAHYFDGDIFPLTSDSPELEDGINGLFKTMSDGMSLNKWEGSFENGLLEIPPFETLSELKLKVEISGSGRK
jgi:hypothetical protein